MKKLVLNRFYLQRSEYKQIIRVRPAILNPVRTSLRLVDVGRKRKAEWEKNFLFAAHEETSSTSHNFLGRIIENVSAPIPFLFIHSLYCLFVLELAAFQL